MEKKQILRVIFSCAISIGMVSTAEAVSIYYTNLFSGYIQQVNTNTGATTTLRQVGNGLRGMAIDESANSLYWSDVTSNSIERVNLDAPSGASSTLVGTGLAFPQDIKLSTSTGQLFWIDSSMMNVEVINTDSTGRNNLFSVQSTSVALDEVNQMIYAENRLTAARGSIVRSSYDGTGFEVVIDDVPTATGIAVDAINEHIYWTSSAGDGGVYRVGFDGFGFTELFVMGSNLDTSAPVLDIDNGKLYWGQEISTNIYGIYQMNLDGSGVEVVVDSVGGNITEMVVSTVPIPSAVWFFGSGLLGLIGVARRKVHV